MNKLNVIFVVVALVIGLMVGYGLHGSSQSFGATSCGSITCLSGGLRLVTGNGGDFENDLPTVLNATTTFTTAATTTTLFLSTASKGWCSQFNATSSATVLNMTFAATSSAVTTGTGVIPVVAYGACN